MSRQSSMTAVTMMYCTGTCTYCASKYGDMTDVERYRTFATIERQCSGVQLVFHIPRSIALRGVAEAFPAHEHVACTFKLVMCPCWP